MVDQGEQEEGKSRSEKKCSLLLREGGLRRLSARRKEKNVRANVIEEGKEENSNSLEDRRELWSGKREVARFHQGENQLLSY